MNSTSARNSTTAKYGKSSRKPAVYDFYTPLPDRKQRVTAQIRLPLSPDSPGDIDRGDNEHVVPSPSQSPAQAHVVTHSASPVSSVNPPALSATPPGSTSPASNRDLTMFDMDSSEDDRITNIMPTTKRRKLDLNPSKSIQPRYDGRAAKPGTSSQSPVRKSKKGTAPYQPGKSQSDLTRPPRVPVKTLKPQTVPSKALTTRHHGSFNEVELKPDPSIPSKHHNKVLPPASTTKNVRPLQTRKAPTRQVVKTKVNRQSPIQVAQNSEVERQEQGDEDIILIMPPSETATAVLGIRNFRAGQNSTTCSPPRCGRLGGKLRARLGAQLVNSDEEGSSSSEDDEEGDTIMPFIRIDDDQRSATGTCLSQAGVAESMDSQPTRPTLSRAASSQGGSGYARGKVTYAKERSHLRDMVAEIDQVSVPGSQEESQRIVAQLAAAQQPSQLQAQLDFEDTSSEDGMPTGKIKSVHELRQTGASNKFGQELDDILDDIKPTVNTSKAIRISALMRMVARIKDEAFAKFACQRALSNLIDWYDGFSDQVTVCLLEITIAGFLVFINSSKQFEDILSAIIKNIRSFGSILTLPQLVRDRKQNLSKSLQKELLDFESNVFDSSMIEGYRCVSICPDILRIALINDIGHRLFKDGGGLEFPQSCLIAACDLLDSVRTTKQDLSKNITIGHKQQHTDLALSFLKLTSVLIPKSADVNQPMVQRLAELLEDTMRQQADASRLTALEVAICITNDRPGVCNELISTTYTTDTISVTVGSLRAVLEHDEVSRLDEATLRIAYLLNLTEHDDNVRSTVARKQVPSSNLSFVQELCNVFEVAASKLLGTTDLKYADQLVLFGYMSLLICSLARCDGVLRVSKQALDKFRIKDVVRSARELLVHRRASEQMQQLACVDGNVSLAKQEEDGLLTRFEQILDEVER